MSKGNESDKIFGYDWDLLLSVQRKQASFHSAIPARAEGADYGADPIGDDEAYSYDYRQLWAEAPRRFERTYHLYCIAAL